MQVPQIPDRYRGTSPLNASLLPRKPPTLSVIFMDRPWTSTNIERQVASGSSITFSQSEALASTFFASLAASCDVVNIWLRLKQLIQPQTQTQNPFLVDT